MLALLSDIHANLEALRACMAHAQARGATRFAFLGDLVGYGADPGAVVDIVAEQQARGAVVVKGNHDDAACGAATYLNATAAAAIDWTIGALTRAQRDFLAALPLVVRDDDACFVHATAVRPDRWDYVDSAATAQRSARAGERPCTFSGHVHEQMLYVADAGERMVAFRPAAGNAIPLASRRRSLALVGSVGQPRDGNPAAAYTLVDFAARRITFHRVPYDHHAAARKVREAGLPPALAYRLERGI